MGDFSTRWPKGPFTIYSSFLCNKLEIYSLLIPKYVMIIICTLFLFFETNNLELMLVLLIFFFFFFNFLLQKVSLFQWLYICCYCCSCSAYLSSCHRTVSDSKLLDDPHTFHFNDYFVIGGIRTCLGVSNDPMFLWISLNSWPLNLQLVQSHQAEIIIVKRLVQERNNTCDFAIFLSCLIKFYKILIHISTIFLIPLYSIAVVMKQLQYFVIILNYYKFNWFWGVWVVLLYFSIKSIIQSIKKSMIR